MGQRVRRLEQRMRRLSLAAVALLVVPIGSVSFAVWATSGRGSASEARPVTVVASDGVAPAVVAPSRQVIAQQDQQAERPLAPPPQLDYEQLARALEAILFTKPTCAMRIITADPIDQGIELAIRQPVDAAMVREANCR